MNASNMAAAAATKLVIGVVRFSYVHVFEPWSASTDGKARYCATLLIPKSDVKTVQAVQAAIRTAYEKAVADKWGGKRPAKWFNPLQDGDEPKDDGESRGDAYKGCYFLNAKSSSRPGVVDVRRQPIVDSEEFYSGCYGYASINFSGFVNSGNMGVSCFLNNVMKTTDGEALGSGKSSAEDDFANIDLPFDASDPNAGLQF